MKCLNLLLLVLFVLTAGCSPGQDNPLVGNWKLDEKTGAYKDMPEDKRQKVDVEFKRNDTFTFKVKAGEKVEEIAGTYKLEGDQLTLTPRTENGKATNEKPITVTVGKDMKSFDMPQGAGRIVKQ